MSRVLKPFEFLEPKTVEEAIQMLATHGAEAKVFAGGTDLLVSLKKRKINPQYLIYIKDIAKLDYITYNQRTGLKIGALSSHQSIAESPVVREKFGLLATACNKVGTPQVRNMGTIGGNLCMAGPSQDAPLPLLALGAKVKMVGPNGNRTLPMDKFFLAPFKTAINGSEILTEIQIPNPPPRSAGCYLWKTKITSVDETLVGVAVLITTDTKGESCKDVRIALGSVAPTPIRARRAEDLLRGKKIDDNLVQEAAQAAADETSPRSRADYRRLITRVLVKQAIDEAWQKVK